MGISRLGVFTPIRNPGGISVYRYDGNKSPNLLIRALLIQEENACAFVGALLEGCDPQVELTVDNHSAFCHLEIEMNPECADRDAQPFDVVLLDLPSAPKTPGALRTPDAPEAFDALATMLPDVHARLPEAPVIVLADLGPENEHLALAALQGGAQDCLDKQKLDGQSLLRAMRFAIERVRLVNQRRRRSSEMETNLKLALSATQVGMWSWDLVTGKLTWDDRVLTAFGVSANDFPATYEFFLQRVHPDDADAVDSAVQDCLKRGKEEIQLDYRVVCPDGSVRYVSVMGRTSFGGSGRPIRMAGVLQDVTKVKEEELSVKNLALLRQRQEFAAMLAHDLRTPVIGSQRILSLMIEGNLGEISESNLDLLTRICTSNQTMLHMINNVLDCYKLESGTEKLACTELNVHSLLSNCVAEMKPLADGAKVNLSYSQTPLIRNIRGDQLAMNRVICNLIANAIKFTAEGGTITIAALDRNGEAVLQVRDDGIGIAADDLERLFEGFWQDRPHKYGPKGLGLGLYLCRKLVEAQKGVILCTSAPDVGSVFEITMPYASDRTTPPVVLIVDDTVASQVLMKSCLGALSIHADTVTSGREALDAVKTKEYAAVFMDLVMPDMDGFLTTRAMRKAGVTIPILAFTGHSILNDRDKFVNAGFSDFLEKPVDGALLKNVLQRWIAV